MQELLKNAWLGWQNYIDSGKMAALLFAALLFLWLGRKTGKQKALLGYTAIMAACCVFPVTAAALMLYQTKFYDYEWIWSLVPLTIVISWGIAEFLGGESVRRGMRPEKEKSGDKKNWRFAGFAALTAAVVLLSGSLGEGGLELKEEKEAFERSKKVILALSDNNATESICLLAPKEIMEYARSIDGGIALPYGRNMWDKSLNGYSYDVYSEQIESIYEWMCMSENLGRFDEAVALGLTTEEKYDALALAWAEASEECVPVILEKGVNRLLLPRGIRPGVLEEAEALFGVSARELEEYYLFVLQ